MSSYSVLINESNNAILLIPTNSPDLFDYQQNGFKLQKSGSKKECQEWVSNYWEENYVPDEERIFLTNKN